MAPMHRAQEQITHILDVGICLIVNEVYIDANARANVYLMTLNLSVSFFFSFSVNSSKITFVFDGPTNL